MRFSFHFASHSYSSVPRSLSLFHFAFALLYILSFLGCLSVHSCYISHKNIILVCYVLLFLIYPLSFYSFFHFNTTIFRFSALSKKCHIFLLVNYLAFVLLFMYISLIRWFSFHFFPSYSLLILFHSFLFDFSKREKNAAFFLLFIYCECSINRDYMLLHGILNG